MNYLLDAFLAGFLYGISYTLWLIIGVVLFVVILRIMMSSSDDDDDDDGGTLQPVYQGADK